MLFCDPNFWVGWGIFHGPNSIFRRCLYGKDLFEYNIEYANKFLEAYDNMPKYLDMAFFEAHECTGELVHVLEEPIMKFLDDLSKKKDFNETAIIFYSDHGPHFTGKPWIG